MCFSCSWSVVTLASLNSKDHWGLRFYLLGARIIVSRAVSKGTRQDGEISSLHCLKMGPPPNKGGIVALGFPLFQSEKRAPSQQKETPPNGTADVARPVAWRPDGQGDPHNREIVRDLQLLSSRDNHQIGFREWIRRPTLKLLLRDEILHRQRNPGIVIRL